MMKTQSLFRAVTVFLFAVMIIFPSESQSQNAPFEISPYAGYMLGGSVDFYQGRFKVQDNLNYGGMLAYRLSNSQLIEISYNRMDTQGDWTPHSGYATEYPPQTVDLAINYLQIGSVNELIINNESIRPYGTFTVGTTWFHGKENTAEDEWLFSVTAGLGLKYYITPAIGIRLQARLLLPMVFNGTGFYLGIGTGGASSGVGVSTWAPIVQGDFTGGLVISLGK